MKKVLINLTIIFFIFLSSGQSTFSQNNRDKENNQIGWYALFLNQKLDDKWSLHGEFQWRRADWIAESQQNLYRVGVNYKLHPQVTFRVGYAFADTYKYGKIPISSNAIRFPEHRSYQMVTLTNPIGMLVFSHRMMLEQRWVGRSLNPIATKADEMVYYNRLRYMFRGDIPLMGRPVSNKDPYLAFYDEIMIGFGKNINQNVFDQNRLGLLAGYKFSDTARIEGGYFNQILQFGRLVDGKNFFQHNQGFIIMTYITL